MVSKRVKCLSVAVFSIIFLLVSSTGFAQHNDHEDADAKHDKQEEGHRKDKKKGFNASEVIFGHVLNAHEFHFLDIGDHPVTIPLPVILYSPQRGFTSFMSSKFEHGHKTHNGYAILTDHSIHEMGLDTKKFYAGDIVAVNDGKLDASVKVYDLSLTRNVVQMFLALISFRMDHVAYSQKIQEWCGSYFSSEGFPKFAGACHYVCS